MNKHKHPRLCVYVVQPYDGKRRLTPPPLLLMRDHARDLEQFLKDCLAKIPPYVRNNKAGTFHFGLEVGALVEKPIDRRWSSAFGNSLESFLREHLEPFFPKQQTDQELQQKAA